MCSVLITSTPLNAPALATIARLAASARRPAPARRSRRANAARTIAAKALGASVRMAVPLGAATLAGAPRVLDQRRPPRPRRGDAVGAPPLPGGGGGRVYGLAGAGPRR